MNWWEMQKKKRKPHLYARFEELVALSMLLNEAKPEACKICDGTGGKTPFCHKCHGSGLQFCMPSVRKAANISDEDFYIHD